MLAIPVAMLIASGRARPSVALPTAGRAMAMPRSIRSRLLWLPGLMWAGGLAMLVVALARPQNVLSRTRSTTDAIAISLIVDRSLSMNERMIFDGRDGNRLDAVKQVLREFVLGNGRELRGRPDDLIGLIGFAGFADTIAPLTGSRPSPATNVRSILITSTGNRATYASDDWPTPKSSSTIRTPRARSACSTAAA